MGQLGPNRGLRRGPGRRVARKRPCASGQTDCTGFLRRAPDPLYPGRGATPRFDRPPHARRTQLRCVRPSAIPFTSRWPDVACGQTPTTRLSRAEAGRGLVKAPFPKTSAGSAGEEGKAVRRAIRPVLRAARLAAAPVSPHAPAATRSSRTRDRQPQDRTPQDRPSTRSRVAVRPSTSNPHHQNQSCQIRQALQNSQRTGLL